MVFVADIRRFRVRDVPGGLADEVKLALCARFVEVGFLETMAELRAAAE